MIHKQLPPTRTRRLAGIAALLALAALIALVGGISPALAQNLNTRGQPPTGQQKDPSCSVDCRPQLIGVYRGLNNLERGLERKAETRAALLVDTDMTRLVDKLLLPAMRAGA